MSATPEYSCLWDGSESGWVVLEHVEDHEELRVVFGTLGPALNEVKALRSIHQALAALPILEALARVKGVNSYLLGTYESAVARQLRQRCAEASLQVECRAVRLVRRSFFNRGTKHYLLIEDEAAKEAAVLEALRRGLPVVRSAV